MEKKNNSLDEPQAVIYSTMQKMYFVETKTGSQHFHNWQALISTYPLVKHCDVDKVKYY